jgi:hypothetical protein
MIMILQTKIIPQKSNEEIEKIQQRNHKNPLRYKQTEVKTDDPLRLQYVPDMYRAKDGKTVVNPNPFVDWMTNTVEEDHGNLPENPRVYYELEIDSFGQPLIDQLEGTHGGKAEGSQPSTIRIPMET